jgi:hypothetical protein
VHLTEKSCPEMADDGLSSFETNQSRSQVNFDASWANRTRATLRAQFHTTRPLRVRRWTRPSPTARSSSPPRATRCSSSTARAPPRWWRASSWRASSLSRAASWSWSRWRTRRRSSTPCSRRGAS